MRCAAPIAQYWWSRTISACSITSSRIGSTCSSTAASCARVHRSSRWSLRKRVTQLWKLARAVQFQIQPEAQQGAESVTRGVRIESGNSESDSAKLRRDFRPDGEVQ